MTDVRTQISKNPGIVLAKNISARIRPKRPVLPPYTLRIVGVAYLLFGLGENALLALLAFAVLLLGIALLWRPGETPILTLVFGNQWLQASLSLFYGNWRGLNVDHLSLIVTDDQLATVLSLVGLLFLAAGMRLGAGRPYVEAAQVARRTVQQQPQYRFIILYGTALAISLVAQWIALLSPGLRQPLLALAAFRWAAYFMLSFSTFIRRDANRALWLAVFLLELVMSFGGYFSSFKFVFLYTLTALIAAHVKMPARRILAAVTFGAVLIAFGLVWTAVKVEYRSFLSGGEASQTVVVDYSESVEKLVDLVSNLDEEKLGAAVEQLMKRIAYVDYFGAVLVNVPRIVPYENGALWLDAVTRPFMPRLFFPEKEIIDDSEVTRKYTGLDVAGMQQGTTITIGYMGESYVDFGALGMMVPIFGLGLFFGLLYRKLMLHRNSRGIVGMGLSTAVLMTTATNLESSLASMFGAIVVSILVSWLLISYVTPRLLPSSRR